MKVAVTTAGGNLGSEISKTLKKVIGAESVIGIARTPERASYLGIEIRKGDYNRKKDFELALKGIDVVLVVSGMDIPEKRIEQHRIIIEAAKLNGVRKVLYTSIAGKKGNSSFDAIVNSNRQTEKDIQESGLEWSIGRNGLYIEPDVEYIEKYKEVGKIVNCAGFGLCSYTTRKELAFAYTQMVLNDDCNGKVFNLAGESLSQLQLANYLNLAFNTNLRYEEISPGKYLEMQKKTNGDFLGPIIAGIYTKIRNGEFEIPSDYLLAAGRKHQSWDDFFSSLQKFK